MVRVTLRSYLESLKEMNDGSRKVPSLLSIAQESGLAYTGLHRLVTGKTKGVQFETLDKIIKVMTDRGFDTNLHDIIKFRDERGVLQ
ncbi:MAG: helix-turn-helix domain-containing protein [Ardenticatenaceae bacterium]